MTAQRTLVVFSHGKESGPWGSKIRQLADVAQSHGAACISVDYQVNGLLAPDARVRRLLDTVLPAHEKLVLVGSSMGGYVSTVASRTLRPDGLFLLAPAFGLQDYPEPFPVPCAGQISIVHGWRDHVVPCENSIHFARTHAASLHLIDGDHRLNDALPSVLALFDRFMLNIEQSPSSSPAVHLDSPAP